MSARVGVIGHPLRHSISPRFQQAAFDTLGIDARYEAWDTLPNDLESLIDGLRAPDTLGANVTIPYKEAAARYVDRLHETARFVGAINTIVNEDRLLVGFNTDVTGFQTALQESGFDPSGTHVVIWGAGGAARAVAWALIWRDAAALTIVNRTAVRAGRLRHDIATALTGAAADGLRLRAAGADEPQAAAALRACDLVVQCTPVGMRGAPQADALPFPVDALNRTAMVCDLIANPLQTPLLREAHAAGHRVLGGLPMLVHQGAASFELWTRRAPPRAAMLAAARSAMQQPS